MRVALMDRAHESELRRDGSLVTEAENIAAVEEQMSESVSQVKSPVRKVVNEGKTVEERRGEDGLTYRNKGPEDTSDEKLTPMMFSQSKIVGKETKQNKYSVADTVEELDSDDAEERRNDDGNLIPNSKTEKNVESKMVKTTNWKSVKNPKEEETHEADVTVMKNDQMEQLKQTIVEEERDGELVAGIGLHKDARGDSREEESIKQETKDREKRVEEEEDIKHATQEFMEREKEDHIEFSNFTPLLRTSQVGKDSEISATIQTITQSQKPPGSPPFVTFSSPAVSVAPAEARSVSLLEDLLIEVLQSPGKNLKQDKPEVRANPQLESITAAIPTAKPEKAEFIVKDVKSKQTSTLKSKHKLLAKQDRLARKPNTTQPTGRPKTVKLMENMKVTKPTIKRPATDRAASVIKTKSSKAKTKRKSQEQRKKNNKTEKPPEKKKKKKKTVVPTPMPFPYFLDNYCPPECACYGR